MSRLIRARGRFEGEWQSLRRSLRHEVGTEPRWMRSQVLPVLALAAGVLLGAGVWRRRFKRK